MSSVLQRSGTAAFPPPHVAHRLARLGSALGTHLMSVAQQPLGHYLSALVAVAPARASASLTLLLDVLSRHLQTQGRHDADLWCEALAQCPVIQQADHANLLLDRETLLNNVLFALGAHSSRIARAITIQCSSVSCITRRRPYQGPPFLRTRHGLYNVFGLAPRRYAKAAFCELPGPVAMAFSSCGGATPLQDDALLGPLHGHTAPSALESFGAVNASLWDALGGRGLADILFLDDRFSYELVATHLATPTSALHRLVFDRRVRSIFLQIREQAIAGSGWGMAVMAKEPAFFWIRRAHRFEPALVERQNGMQLSIRGILSDSARYLATPDSLRRLLAARCLIPTKMLIYFARCLLPGIRAIGGTSQQDYLRHYQALLLATHAQTDLLASDDLANASRTDLNGFGGAALVEPDTALEHIIAHAAGHVDWGEALGRFVRKPLRQTVGALECAAYLIDPFANGRTL